MVAKDLTSTVEEVVEALLRLRPAGEKSFERLVADLLADMTGLPFRLSRAGDQGGVDALSADGVGLEMKRYEERGLDERELLGELRQAADSNRDLQVWGLATTGEVSAQLEKQLNRAACDLGVGLLILDRATCHPLPIPAIVALAALAPGRFLEAIEAEEWLDPKKGLTPPSSEGVAKALEEVRRLPGFQEWSNKVKDQVRGLPTWDRVRRDQNRRLKKWIQSHAEEYFGTTFDPEAAVPRDVEEEITDWFATARDLKEPPVGVVLGERYDGKTWCVYRWLLQNLDNLPLPVFFVGAKEGDRPDTALKEMIVQEMADALSIEPGRARSIFRRFSSIQAGEGPWGLVILDGLNEYRVDPVKPFQYLAAAAAQRTDLNHRSCAVLATTRTQWWQENEGRIRDSTRRFELGPYSDGELRVALGKWGENLSILETVQESARDLIRRPRYLQLVLNHRDRLDQFGAITADVLHYLDAFDKMRSRGYVAAGTGWDHQAYSETLSSLARTFLEKVELGSLLERRDITTMVADLGTDAQAALQDLESEGAVTLIEGGYRVSPERLITGMGLWLPKALKSAGKGGEHVQETLNDLLEPMKETDEKVAWLRSSVVFELIRAQAGKSGVDEEVLDVLVDQWLRSRNLGKSHVGDMEALGSRLLSSLLRLAPRTWSEIMGEARLQEISLLVFSDVARQSDRAQDRSLLQAAAQSWCRRVPKMGTRFLRADDPEGEIQERLQDPMVMSLGLSSADDRGALKLQRAALYLESLSPGLLDDESVLAVAAIEQIAPNPLDDAERRLVRRALADTPRDWFENQVLGREGRTELWRAICHGLLGLADRADLQDLNGSVAPPPDPERERLYRRLWPTIEEHYRLGQTAPAADEDVLRFAERSRRLVLDPEHPRPVRDRVEAIADHARDLFEGVHLQTGRMVGAEGHRFRHLTPSLAAWLPAVGVEIVEDQIRDLPRRFRIDDEEEESTYFSWNLDRHSVLLRGDLRRQVLLIPAHVYPDNRRGFDAALVFVALLPGMTAPRRLDSILDHCLQLNGKQFEWIKLYELAAFLADTSFLEALRSRLETEDDPLKLERLRLLTVEIGGVSISESQARRIERDLTAADEGIRLAAVATGAEAKLTALRADLLLQLVREEDHRTSLTPRYAAWLLVQKGECLDELPIYWQAVAAVRHPARRESFLQDVERALHASIWSEEVARDPLDNILIRTAPDDPVAHRVGVADDAVDSTLYFYAEDPGIGGLEERDDSEGEDPFGAQGRVVEKKNRLARKAALLFETNARNHERAWESEVFPQELVESLPPERFKTWAQLLLSAGPKAEILWTGLLQSMFRRALREGGDSAQGLFHRCFPFSRRGSLGVVRFVAKGLHWTLHHLFDSKMADQKSRELISELALDCRTDLELFEVALAARLGEVARLEGLVEEWLLDSESEIRSRGVRLAGWLTGFWDQLETLQRDDPSLYVRKLAAAAMETEQRERWAQEWFRIFISNESPEKQWGAGQLFLECADRRVECWIPQELESVARTRAQGEAFLLLDATRKEAKKREKKLKDTFLGVKVRDLQNLCHPWRPEGSWRRLEPRS